MVDASSLIIPRFHDVLGDVMAHGHTHYWLHGGRGSTKSSFISVCIVLLLLAHPEANAVVVRRFSNTLRDSVFSQMTWAIAALGLDAWFRARISPMELTYLPTGQRIVFRGADDPLKLKGVKFARGYAAVVWFEELDQFGMNLPRFRLHPYAAFRRRSSSGRLARSSSSGLRYPSAECVLTLLQKHSMHSKVSSAAWSRLSKVRACTHSALMTPMSDSMAALPQGDDIDPIDGSIPASRIVLPSSSEACCGPWSPWWMQPSGGRLRAIAILSAPSASSAVMRADIDQPTTLLDHTSIKTARQGQPWWVPT